MANSIYVYEDKWNDNKVVYLGKSVRPETRHQEHLTSRTPSKFDNILRKYPDRYRFKVIIRDIDEEWFHELESFLIWALKKLGTCDHNLVVDLDRAVIQTLEEKEI